MSTISARIKVSGGQLGNQEVELPVEVDFSDATQDEILDWAMSNRKIALQRVLRQLSVKELWEYKSSGLKVKSRDCGRKIESREDKIKRLEDAGLPREVAELAVDNPNKMKGMIDNLKK